MQTLSLTELKQNQFFIYFFARHIANLVYYYIYIRKYIIIKMDSRLNRRENGRLKLSPEKKQSV